MKYLGLTILATLCTLPAFGQDYPTPPVAESVQDFIESNGSDVSKFIPSCASFEACSDMYYHIKTYTFKGDAQKAFDLLLSLKPYEIWDGTSRFEMEFDPAQKIFLGKGQNLPDIKEGQIFFLELDITKKMHIPMAFQVMELNSKNKTISFSYLKQNKSNGIQRITFVQNGENFNVVHETHFKSDSKFRDKRLYGFFHTKLLNDVWKRFGERL